MNNSNQAFLEDNEEFDDLRPDPRDEYPYRGHLQENQSFFTNVKQALFGGRKPTLTKSEWRWFRTA